MKLSYFWLILALPCSTIYAQEPPTKVEHKGMVYVLENGQWVVSEGEATASSVSVLKDGKYTIYKAIRVASNHSLEVLKLGKWSQAVGQSIAVDDIKYKFESGRWIVSDGIRVKDSEVQVLDSGAWVTKSKKEQPVVSDKDNPIPVPSAEPKPVPEPTPHEKIDWGYVKLTNAYDGSLFDSAFASLQENNHEGLYWAIRRLKAKNHQIDYPLAVVRYEAMLTYNYYIVSDDFLKLKLAKQGKELKVGETYYDNGTYKIIEIFASEPSPMVAQIPLDCSDEQNENTKGVKGQARCSEEPIADKKHDPRISKCFYLSKWEVEKLPHYRKLIDETNDFQKRNAAWARASFDGFTYEENGKKLYCGFFQIDAIGGRLK